MGRVDQALVVFDSAADGPWNMAVDEALLRSCSAYCVLRFYEWTPATLSLGYFQSTLERCGHKDSLSAPMVRRSTGGGAIVHDKELTYSLTVPADHPSAGEPHALYERMHCAITRAVADWGVQLASCPTNRIANRLGDIGDSKPFLCFQTQTQGDLLLGQDKIVGSAQRRRREGVLQHGSILLEASASARELPGIHELSGVMVCPRELRQAITREMAKFAAFEKGELPDNIIASAHDLCRVRFGTDSWNQKR